MARGKRAQVLTAEEKFKQALVPESEQPYKVPENWVWTRIQFCTYVFSGKSPKYVKEANKNIIIGQQANQEYGIDLRYTKYCTDAFWESMPEEYFLKPNDVLLNTLGTGTIGSSWIFTDPNTKILTDGHLFIFRVYLNCLPRIIFYYLKYNQQHIIDSANGSTNQKFLSLTKLCQDAIPIPPLAEQRRIVARIESLFEKLDHARELVQSALDSFKNRKSAILHKAFAGELTVKWRCENGLVKNTVISSITAYSKVLSKKDQKHIKAFQSHVKIVEMSNGQQWFSCQIGAVGVVTNGSTPSRKVPDFWKDGTIPWVSSGEVRNNVIETTHEKITTSGCDNSSVKQLPVGTVLIAMIGEGKTRGQSAVLNIPATTNQNVAAIIIDHGFIVPHFLWYWLQKEYTKNREKGNGTGPQALNCQRVRELDIVIPPFEEQQEIVRILDSLLEKEQHAEDKLEPILDQIDLLKKSILARAFRGELGTNDPSEETAVELLKEVLE